MNDFKDLDSISIVLEFTREKGEARLKTSAKDFEVFKKEFKKWQKFLSIENYEIDFQHVKLQANDAEVQVNYEGGIAEVRLSTEVTRSKGGIPLIACHEAIELFTYPLYALGSARFHVCKDELERACHGVVQGLMDIFYFKNREIPK